MLLLDRPLLRLDSLSHGFSNQHVVCEEYLFFASTMAFFGNKIEEQRVTWNRVVINMYFLVLSLYT
jgi:hypothetical protein